MLVDSELKKKTTMKNFESSLFDASHLVLKVNATIKGLYLKGL